MGFWASLQSIFLENGERRGYGVRGFFLMRDGLSIFPKTSAAIYRSDKQSNWHRACHSHRVHRQFGFLWLAETTAETVWNGFYIGLVNY